MAQIIRADSGPQCLSNTVLNRREARSRLHLLTPGTEEYNKLQGALTRTVGIVEISLRTAAYKVDTSSEDYLTLGGFGPSEHVAIGKSVTLPELPPDTPLIERGSTKVRFDQIVALAGDYYGIAGQAISLPSKTPEERIERFKNAFNSLAEEADPDELEEVLKEVEQECHEVHNSSLPHHCYSSHLMAHMEKTQKIKPSFQDLLLDNSDHFSEEAENAYIAGHTYALQVAHEAGRQPTQEQKLAMLKLAYAIDAFACHFLTDLFAAGHMRNQRGKLELFLLRLVESSLIKLSGQNVKQLAAILTGAQHEKDGNEGLNVRNDNDEFWRAYGDGSFFTPNNKENRKKAEEAIKQSVKDVHGAYKAGSSLQNAPFQGTVYRLIPKATPFNPPPLYFCDGRSLSLYHDGSKVEIETLDDYLAKGLSQALRYLPEDYINGLILSKIGATLHLNNISIPVPIKKIVIPLGERMTGVLWHIIGVATYYQVKGEGQRLNAKVDEVADSVVATYNESLKIFEEIQHLKIQNIQLQWNSIIEKEVKEPVINIKNELHYFEGRKIENMEIKELEAAELILRNGYNALTRVFTKGTALDELSILSIYTKILAESDTTRSLIEGKLIVTLWFRKILEVRKQAFTLYVMLKLKRIGFEYDGLQEEMIKFEFDSLNLSKVNQSYIYLEFINESPSYINHQLAKVKTIEKALDQLKDFT